MGGEAEQVHREKTALQAQHKEALRLCDEALDALKSFVELFTNHADTIDIVNAKQDLCDLRAELEDMDVAPLLSVDQEGKVSQVNPEDWSTLDKVALCPVCNPRPINKTAGWTCGCGQHWSDRVPYCGICGQEKEPKWKCIACELVQPATNEVCPHCGQHQKLVREPGPINPEPRAEQAGYALEQQEDY